MPSRDLWGGIEITFNNRGVFFSSTNDREMEDLVAAGVCTREETTEPWGPCISYLVTEAARDAMVLHWCRTVVREADRNVQTMMQLSRRR